MCEALEDRRLLAVSLQLDYSLDGAGFFTADRKALLQSTLTAITSRLGDTLAAVSSNTYTITTSTGARTVTTAVAADTLKIYVLGDSLSGSTVGQGGASWSVIANNAMRGQGANDYAPNIGYIRFDNDGSTNWFFGSSTTGLTSDKTDFVSVARHEFLHVLGMTTTQPTFSRFVQNSTFIGPNAKAAFHGDPVPLSGSHIASQVASVMNPASLNGTREDLRNLEWGILKDMGWDVRTPAGFYRNWDLYTGGDGDGTTTVKIVPSRGVYMMQIDVLAGDKLRLRTRDGTIASEKGVDSYVKIFNAAGQQIDSSDDSAAADGKEDFTHTFATGGTYWVGVSTYDQRNYTFTTPSTATPPSTAFYLEATLTGVADTEPDNIAGATGAIAFNAGTYTRHTTLAGFDYDYYPIEAQAGHFYVIKTELPAAGGLSGSTIATVYDATGRKVAGMDDSSRYGLLNFKPLTSGRYYVLVTSGVGADKVALDERHGTIGGGTVVSGGEYASDFNRTGGSDYTLTIIDQVVPIQLAGKPLYMDMGLSGLWGWSVESGFKLLTTTNPEGIVAAPDGSVYVDFGPSGLWRWSNDAGFQMLNAANPEGFSLGSDGVLYLDFGAYGLWRLMNGGFQQLSGANAEGLTPGRDGTLYIDFGPSGLWRWAGAGGFQQLNAANPEGLAAGIDGFLYIDFGPSGLWRWSGAGGFQKLNAANPDGLTAGADGFLYIDFGPSGLWRWSGAGGYQQLNTANPDGLAFGTDGFLYIDFGPSGLWRWTTAGGYQQLTTANPEGISVV